MHNEEKVIYIFLKGMSERSVMPDLLRDTLVAADYLAAKATQGWLVEAEEDAKRITEEFLDYYRKRDEKEAIEAFRHVRQQLMSRVSEHRRASIVRSKFYYQIYLLIGERCQIED